MTAPRRSYGRRRPARHLRRLGEHLKQLRGDVSRATEVSPGRVEVTAALAEQRLGDVQHERRGSSDGTANMASARATASPARYLRVFTVGSEVCERVGGIDQLAGIFLVE